MYFHFHIHCEWWIFKGKRHAKADGSTVYYVLFYFFLMPWGIIFCEYAPHINYIARHLLTRTHKQHPCPCRYRWVGCSYIGRLWFRKLLARMHALVVRDVGRARVRQLPFTVSLGECARGACCAMCLSILVKLCYSPSISAARKILLEACVYAFQRTYLYLQVRNVFSSRYDIDCELCVASGFHCSVHSLAQQRQCETRKQNAHNVNTTIRGTMKKRNIFFYTKR